MVATRRGEEPAVFSPAPQSSKWPRTLEIKDAVKDTDSDMYEDSLAYIGHLGTLSTSPRSSLTFCCQA